MTKILVITGIILLMGCSGSNQQAAIRDRQLDYQAAYVEPKLKIPTVLSDYLVNEALRIPGVDETTAGLYGGSFEAPRSESALRGLTLPTIRRYRIGELQWLSIPDQPSTVLPELERFMSDNKIQIVSSKQMGGVQTLDSSVFRGAETNSGSRIIRHFLPKMGDVSLRFFVGPGLRIGTSEIRLEPVNGVFDQELIGRILDEFKYHFQRRGDKGSAVSRALSMIQLASRMEYRRTEGVDELIIDAGVNRVFGVTIDAARDFGATIDAGDLEQGLITIRYVQKETARRLSSMSALNRAIATAIEAPVGSYQIQIKSTDEGTTIKVIPTEAAASLGGANEIIREFRERLY